MRSIEGEVHDVEDGARGGQFLGMAFGAEKERSMCMYGCNVRRLWVGGESWTNNDMTLLRQVLAGSVYDWATLHPNLVAYFDGVVRVCGR